MTEQFVELSDAWRTSHPHAHNSELTKALIAGKTLFVPLDGKPVGTLRNGLASRVEHDGLRLRSYQTDRDGVRGLVVWTEPKVVQP